MTIVRALSVAAVVLGLLGLWLRFSRSPLPQAAAAPLPLRTAGQAATAPAGATAAPRYEAIVAANIFSQTRTAPLVRFAPAGRAARRDHRLHRHARAAVRAADPAPAIR